MSAPKSPPPDLPGFEFLKGLGGGGFADVFLYQQRRPSRQVAIKVLRDEHLSDDNLRQFETEADLMAELSDHPHIVTIHLTDLAPDGRPYIVMEYCPQPHFGLRARGGQMPVAEVLRVGVQVASAVEAAHEAEILHRDIKPANILTTAYGGPGLTDFGIAGVVQGNEVEGAGGVSYAYAAPEVIEDPNLSGSRAADVYSLGATIYCLLAGRAPFWVPGGNNSNEALVARVLAGKVPALGRPDVPAPLEHLLQQMLARDPAARPPSASAVARSLQDVEQGLRLSPTPIPSTGSLTRDAGAGRDRSDDDGTRRGGISVVNPEGSDAQGPTPGGGDAAAPGGPLAPTPSGPRQVATASAGVGESGDLATVRREGRRKQQLEKVPPPPPSPTILGEDRDQDGAQSTGGPAPVERARRPWLIAAGATAVLVVVAVVAVIFVGSTGSDGEAQEDASDAIEAEESEPPPLAIAIEPDPPEAVQASLSPDGVLTVSAEAPPMDDAVDWKLVVMRNDGAAWPNDEMVTIGPSEGASADRAEISGLDPSARVCVDVFTQVGTSLSAAPTSACAEPGSGG